MDGSIQNNRCFLFFYSSGIASDDSCPSGCIISNCQACYYSYAPLPLPKLDSSCPTSCISGGEISESCLNNWGKCVRRAYTRTYSKVVVMNIYLYGYVYNSV